MELSHHQAEALRERLVPALGYLSKLRRRMEQVRFDGKLYHDVVRAQMAMQDLCGELHYRSCENGVGRTG